MPNLICIGDLHGSIEALQEDLAHARLVDSTGTWIGQGGDTFVQLGDVINRGDSSIACWGFLRKIQHEAAQKGGRVVRLLGNHELMPFQGFRNYIMQTPDIVKYGVDLFLKEMATEVRNRMLQGAYASNGFLFVHGGLRTKVRDFLLEDALGLSATCRQDMSDEETTVILAKYINEETLKAFRDYSFSNPVFWVGRERGGYGPVGGVFWSGFEQIAGSADFSQKLYEKQVVGHTPERKRWALVRLAAGGRILNVDVGHHDSYGGNRGYLEIVDGEIFQHIKGEDGKWKKMLLLEGEWSDLADMENVSMSKQTKRVRQGKSI